MRDFDARDTDGSSATWTAMIVDHARTGTFNRNPLLTTAHRVTCPQCRHNQHVVYLDHLLRGAFKVRETANIEVYTSQGPIGFLETQQFTPIIITLVCERCHGRIDVAPVSVEYLLGIIARPTASGNMYV